MRVDSHEIADRLKRKARRQVAAENSQVGRSTQTILNRRLITPCRVLHHIGEKNWGMIRTEERYLQIHAQKVMKMAPVCEPLAYTVNAEAVFCVL